MSKLDAKVFSSITPFSKQWILGEELMYEFLNQYQDFLSDSYGIVDLSSLEYSTDPDYPNVFSGRLPDIVYIQPLDGDITISCTKYEAIKPAWRAGVGDKQICQAPGTTGITIKDTNYTTAAAFKTAMQGVYLVYKLANGVKRKSYIFNKANQDNITYFGLYSDLQTFYTNIGDTEHIAAANIYLTSSNSNWVYKNYDEVDHSYRLQHGPTGTENVGRAYVFVNAPSEFAARKIINNDPVIVYCYYKES